MKVTLNIENDAELRAYIKDCVKGQVLSIVREEFNTIIKEELERHLKKTSTANFDFLLKNAMKESVGNILIREYGVSSWGTDYIKPYVSEKLTAVLANKDWNSLIDTLAKEKVKALLQ